ncbi:MAG: hypothetical protein AVDCRST_MAG89-2311, partial [uncultured Gemmatimonadetes bacterium]
CATTSGSPASTATRCSSSSRSSCCTRWGRGASLEAIPGSEMER